jgi:hypothetical protein
MQRELGQPWLSSVALVPGWPSHLYGSSIQSPYIHRASGLLQIAVSTPLRTTSIAGRKFMLAERCRYGTLSSTDVATGECSGSFRKPRFSGIYCTVTVTVPVFMMAREVAVTVMM